LIWAAVVVPKTTSVVVMPTAAEKDAVEALTVRVPPPVASIVVDVRVVIVPAVKPQLEATNFPVVTVDVLVPKTALPAPSKTTTAVPPYVHENVEFAVVVP
jgi:hypothetical protein